MPKAYLVGAGPTDRALLTLRGGELLSSADMVFYDPEVHSDILRLIPAESEQVAVSRGETHHCQKFIACVKADHRVVRLIAGDALFFRDIDDELQALASAASGASGEPRRGAGLYRGTTVGGARDWLFGRPAASFGGPRLWGHTMDSRQTTRGRRHGSEPG